MNPAVKSERVQPVIEWGVAKIDMPGQEQSGDLHLVELFPDGALVAAVDGLGHGAEAAAAAKLAVAIMAQHAQEPVIALLQRCHEALKRTRGAVISLANFQAGYNTLTWLGVGNVEGTLVRAEAQPAPPRETILLVGGVVGFQLPPLRATVVTVHPGDTMVFATDGIRSGWAQEVLPGDHPQRIANVICARYNKGTDDALVVVTRYLGGGS